MHLLAPIVSNPITIWGFVALLVAAATSAGIPLHVRTRRLIKAFDRARARLAQADDPRAFAERYESLATELADDALLGPAWRGYRETLLLPAETGGLVRSTARPDDWFNCGLLRAVDVDVRLHAAMPNLLVGAGLLFTFLGLAVALSAAGGIVAEGVSNLERNAKLHELLDAASFKFITSLAGLFLSLGYALFRKSRLRRVDRALDAFNQALEHRAPLISAVALQQRTNEIAERQAAQLETFSTELAVNIGTAFDAAFDQRLGEHIQPLTEAMQQLARGMASRTEDAMTQMLDRFLAGLQGGAGDRMNEVAESLSGLGARLEGLQSSLGDAAVRMAEAADQMARRMGDGAESALARITDQMGGLAASLRGMADQTRSAGADAGRELAERMEAASRGFEQTAGKVGEALARAAEAMERRMGEEAAASSGRLTAQFERMLGELRALSEASQASGSVAFEALASRITTAAEGFEATAAKVSASLAGAAADTGGALGRGAEEAVGRIAIATEGMRSELVHLLAEFRQTMGSASDALRDGGAEGAAALRGVLQGSGQELATAIGVAAGRVEAAAADAAESLRRGGSEAGDHLHRAAGAIGGRAEEMGRQGDRLGEATGRVADQLAELDRVTRAAATPLAASAADMRAASEAVRAGTEPLREVARAVSTAIEQVGGAAARLEVAQVGATRLAEALSDAARRFEGVDADLGKTLTGLQHGLQSFTQEVTRFVGETDGNLAKAATHIAAMVRGLDDSLADLRPARV